MAHQPLRAILTHGFNGEPVELHEVEDDLKALGWSVTNQLLPGHGVSLRDFARSGWDDWYGAVAGEARIATARGERVVLIGHSLGAALSLLAAARIPGIAGVVALCPPLAIDPRAQRRVAHARSVIPYIPSWGEDLRDRKGARSAFPRHVHRWTPLASLHSLLITLPIVRSALPEITCPALVICSRNDHVAPVQGGLDTYALLGSAQKELLVLERSYHAVTKNVERVTVRNRILVFCQKLGSATPAE